MSEMKHIRVLFFATLRDLAGARSIEFNVPIDMTVQGLKIHLAGAYPALRHAMDFVLVSINREYSPDEVILPAEAEIAMFPPVSGG